MAKVDVNPMPGVRALRFLQGTALRVSELVATMLDVEPSRLRAELAAVRPKSRWLMVAFVATIVCSVVGTIVAILYLTSSSATAAAPAEQVAVRLETSSGDSYDAIVKRPLFYRSRQPATAPADRVGLSAIGDPQVTLKGVFINGDVAKAFIVSAENPTGAWRNSGEDIAGWRVGEIFANHVVLESRSQQLVVPLTHSNGR